jgi:hypothetical protein
MVFQSALIMNNLESNRKISFVFVFLISKALICYRAGTQFQENAKHHVPYTFAASFFAPTRCGQVHLPSSVEDLGGGRGGRPDRGSCLISTDPKENGPLMPVAGLALPLPPPSAGDEEDEAGGARTGCGAGSGGARGGRCSPSPFALFSAPSSRAINSPDRLSPACWAPPCWPLPCWPPPCWPLPCPC